MPLDIGALLGTYGEGMKALLRAAGLPEQMMGDAVSGGTPAPAAPAAPAAAGPQSAADFLTAGADYARAHPGAQALLGGARRRGAHDPHLVLTPGVSGVDALTRVAQSGPRAGQRFQPYDVGGGRTAHVYIDAKGKRQVFVR